MQTFDFAQYFAFKLIISAHTLIYYAFAPIVVLAGTFYFGYRYVVDKYNFLFVFRVRGFAMMEKLIATVLRIMRVCVVLFLLSMLFFFSVQGYYGTLKFLFYFYFGIDSILLHKMWLWEINLFDKWCLSNISGSASIRTCDNLITFHVFIFVTWYSCATFLLFPNNFKTQ